MNRLLLLMAAALTLSCMVYTCKDMPPGPDNDTPDTTSHNFAWQTFVLGDGASSMLNDVAIVNDTLVYAVGEINKKDSLGQWENPPYGFAKWNGVGWSLFRLEATGPTGIVSHLRPSGIIAFSANDIWFASGGVFHWNGTTVTPYWINAFPGNPNPIFSEGQTAEKLWGTSSQNLFVVGRAGAIAYYNGSTWQKIESGTTTAVTDVWGLGTTILATVTSEFGFGDRRLIQISPNGRIDTLDWSPGSRLQTVWFQSPEKIFIGGGKHVVGTPGKWQQIFDLPAYYSKRIRGNGENDVFMVGALNLCAHYNGRSWKTFYQLYNADAALEGLAVKHNTMIAVGQVGNKGLVIFGKRE